MELPTHTTSGPCEVHHRHAIYIPGLTLTHDGGRVLFHNSDLLLTHGTITALVGTNGSGKTSLAKLLASQQHTVCESKSSHILNGFPTNNFTVEYLAAADDEDDVDQSVPSHENCDLDECHPKEYIRYRLKKRIDRVHQSIEDLEGKLALSNDPDAMVELTDELSTLYEIEEKMTSQMQEEISRSMNVVGLKRHEHKKFSELSCGWRYKCQLIASVLSHPEMLIIDEPSFLDETSTEWLIASLIDMANNEKCIIILISHKESLLDSLADRVMYINSGNHTLSTYSCGYYEFRTRHENEIYQATKIIDDTEYEVEKADKQLKKLNMQMKKNEKNLKKSYNRIEFGKITKTQVHADMGGRSQEKKQRGDKSAASKLRRLRKNLEDAKDVHSNATKREKLKPLSINGIPASNQTIIRMESVSFRYHEDDEFVFENVDAIVESTDRVLLKGPNGSGKSTLVNLILGRNLVPTEGSIHTSTENVLYFPQTAIRDLTRQHGDLSATAFLMAASPDKLGTITQARIHLGRYGLENDLAIGKISSLSAGQRVRLWIAHETLLRPNPSLLIFDEVSENVDVDTRNSLVELFEAFQGAVLVISHDPDFCRPLVDTSASFTKIWTLHRYGLHVEFINDS
ncbi:hypothetical protein HJC23_003371 [Cyclotella cryptica]|uniref:ABC transporter domain-containing protein n=1 Tax=Cyclotella cryptica TaxID=29204 RepID=A0ABD3QXI7_9STRA|eukprot:CCRYP_000953-RA/>CCRYP_000953-RA protein AED:0.22 eAED:0.22 QI:0/-1/0/1/-1/1/1/0/627